MCAKVKKKLHFCRPIHALVEDTDVLCAFVFKFRIGTCLVTCIGIQYTGAKTQERFHIIEVHRTHSTLAEELRKIHKRPAKGTRSHNI